MSGDFAAGLQDDEALSMLRRILSQNSQILAQNADINFRLIEVEKEQKEQKRAQHSSRSRPRSKCADGLPWKCPVCGSTHIKHLDSFISHIRKLAVATVHPAPRRRQARCRLDLDNSEHLALVVKFAGVSNADKAQMFARHFLHVCRSISALATSDANKYSGIMEWLNRVVNDPTFSVDGDCPAVSDSISSDNSRAVLASSSGSDAAHWPRVRVGQP
jgi:hypothetical protein